MKKFYINVAMGTGANIALASILTKIKEDHPGEYWFAVMSPYSDIFECCKAVDAVYKPQEARDFIFDANNDKDAELVMHRPYDMDGFIKKELNYQSAWYKLLHIEDEAPKVMNVKATFDTSKFNQAAVAKNVLTEIKKRGFKYFVIMQFTGGQSPLVQVPPKTAENGQQVPDWSKVQYNYENEPLKRHYPIEKAQEFVDKFAAEYPETAIILYQLPNEPAPQNKNIVQMTIPYLAYWELSKLPECEGVVAIDSSLQHLIAGACKAVIIWAHSINAETNGKIIYNNFGYGFNTNVVQPCRRDDVLFFSLLGPSGARVQYIEPDELLNIVKKTFDENVIGNYYKENGEYILDK